MTITIYPDLIQGSDEWMQARCGLLTASEMKLIITPTLKIASNDKERAHIYELAAQRITNYVEPSYVGDDMLRGHIDEVEAKLIYAANYEPVSEVGFITRQFPGVKIGFSPDGLVGDTGFIEAKSRRQKFQVETIIANACPAEHMLQVQTGLLVTGREWCDFISYCGGMPMMTVRVYPDPVIQAAILEAAVAFEQRLIERIAAYNERLNDGARLIPTERKVEMEMYV